MAAKEGKFGTVFDTIWTCLFDVGLSSFAGFLGIIRCLHPLGSPARRINCSDFRQQSLSWIYSHVWKFSRLLTKILGSIFNIFLQRLRCVARSETPQTRSNSTSTTHGTCDTRVICHAAMSSTCIQHHAGHLYNLHQAYLHGVQDCGYITRQQFSNTEYSNWQCVCVISVRICIWIVYMYNICIWTLSRLGPHTLVEKGLLAKRASQAQSF